MENPGLIRARLGRSGIRPFKGREIRNVGLNPFRTMNERNKATVDDTRVGRFNLRRLIGLLLGLAQLTTVVLMVADLGAILTFAKWSTKSYFAPWQDYLASLEVMIPSALVMVVLAVIFLVTGVPANEVPHVVQRALRNRFLQSYLAMGPFIVVSIFAIGCVVHIVASEPPPRYSAFVNTILRGETDEYADARSALADITKVNPSVGVKFGAVLKVFEERTKRNTGHQVESNPSDLIRMLRTDAGGDWEAHPLRRHALAEAYVLSANVLDDGDEGATILAGLRYDNAIELYKSVVETPSPLATDRMRASAFQNTGNIHLYRNRPDAAAAVFSTIIDDDNLRNTASWGNLIAALTLAKKAKEAITMGVRARQWAQQEDRIDTETSQYMGILENTAHAYWARGQFSSAHNLLDEAILLRPKDPITRGNFAASFAFLGNREQASAHMRRVVEPARVDNAMDLAVLPDANVCDFLMWAAILPRERVAARAANLSVFLREPVEESELQGFTEREVAEMAMRVLDSLRAVYKPCSSLDDIPRFRELLLGPSPQ